MIRHCLCYCSVGQNVFITRHLRTVPAGYGTWHQHLAWSCRVTLRPPNMLPGCAQRIYLVVLVPGVCTKLLLNISCVCADACRQLDRTKTKAQKCKNRSAVYICDRLLQKLYRKPRSEKGQLACHTQAEQNQNRKNNSQEVLYGTVCKGTLAGVSTQAAGQTV